MKLSNMDEMLRCEFLMTSVLILLNSDKLFLILNKSMDKDNLNVQNLKLPDNNSIPYIIAFSDKDLAINYINRNNSTNKNTLILELNKIEFYSLILSSFRNDIYNFVIQDADCLTIISCDIKSGYIFFNILKDKYLFTEDNINNTYKIHALKYKNNSIPITLDSVKKKLPNMDTETIKELISNIGFMRYSL